MITIDPLAFARLDNNLANTCIAEASVAKYVGIKDRTPNIPRGVPLPLPDWVGWKLKVG